MRIQIPMEVRSFKLLCDYLTSHEDDIKLEINDFGDLKPVYYDIYEDEDPQTKTP